VIKFYTHKPGYFDDHGECYELEHISCIQLYVDISPFAPIYKVPYPSVYRPYEYKLVAEINDELAIIGYVEDGRDLELPIWKDNDTDRN